MNQFLLISSINEINSFGYSNWQRIVSLVTAFIVVILCLAILFIVMYLTFSNKYSKQGEESKFKEFFCGLKTEKKFKIYVAVLVLRRTIFVVMLVIFAQKFSSVVIIALSVLQPLYSIYIMILRPFTEMKWNIIEILNEVYFTGCLCSLIYYNSESRWTNVSTNVYIWVIASNNIIIFLIVISKRKD